MPVKARDLRDNIRTYGFEKGVVATLEPLLEEHAVAWRNMQTLTNLVDQLIDHLGELHQIAEGMRQGIDGLQRAVREPPHET